MYICKYCGKEFETSRKLGGHTSRCSLNPKYKNILDKINNTRKTNIDVNNPVEEHICQCQYCGNDYKVNIRHNSFIKGLYPKTCSSECSHKLSTQNTDWDKTKKNISEALKGCQSVIKGKIRVNGQWVNDPNWKPYRVCPICGKQYKNKKLRYCSEECKKIGKFNRLSNLAKQRHLGGYEPNSIKKHHHGNYKGVHCDSSWELAYLVWCLEHNITIERCSEIRYYTIDTKIYRYFPDFKVNNEIIEIKGYYSKIAKIKAEQNPDIKVLLYDDIKEMLEYTISKYGKNFWEVLYDK